MIEQRWDILLAEMNVFNAKSIFQNMGAHSVKIQFGFTSHMRKRFAAHRLALFACMLPRTPEQNLRYPLLLVHGLFSSSRTWKKTVQVFQQDYDLRYGGEVSQTGFNAETPAAADFYTWNFSDSRNLSYRQQAAELAKGIAHILEKNRTEKIVLAGHSMGGLAARALVQLLAFDKVYALITLGTPHYGSPLALLRESTQGGARKMLGKLHHALARSESQGDSHPGFFKRILLRLFAATTEAEAEIDRFFSSEAFIELAPGSAALEELNRAPVPADIRYVFLTGSVTDFAPFREAAQAASYRKIRKLWLRMTEGAVGSLTRRYLEEPYGIFRKYLQNYLPSAATLSREQLIDFDGAVPVMSQILNHFTTPPALKAVLPVFASHTRLTKRPAKLFQALAVAGVVGNPAARPADYSL